VKIDPMGIPRMMINNGNPFRISGLIKIPAEIPTNGIIAVIREILIIFL
jgi:hypothetical protein